MGRQTAAGDKIIVHYRISIPDGDVILDTHDDEPVALELGAGEIAENLEKCLYGLEEGDERTFNLEPEQAFGLSDPELVQRIELDMFPDDIPVEIDSLIEFNLPSGDGVMGLILDKTEEDALVDFNHPLCDYPLRFEVKVIEILE
ncbi:MAG TPA: FKBP-type peptidyl-prolyl cis-trans isomerase [Sulfuricella sp.]|nr:FKBP-type peptidyl-prolyl cis-trans isomerase [Sulfuricella sp.]